MYVWILYFSTINNNDNKGEMFLILAISYHLDLTSSLTHILRLHHLKHPMSTGRVWIWSEIESGPDPDQIQDSGSEILILGRPDPNGRK